MTVGASPKFRASAAAAVVAIAAAALVIAGCGAGDRQASGAPTTGSSRIASENGCPAAWRIGWQRLADRIHAAVYCPAWLPDPLTGLIGGTWNNINSVSPDRSYLISFIWQEMGQAIHINFRGYPGRTTIPSCPETTFVGGKARKYTTPCFNGLRAHKSLGKLDVTVYTVNQDADSWHVLYAWRHHGSLYTISEHLIPPLTFPQVIRNLNRMTAALVLVQPRS